MPKSKFAVTPTELAQEMGLVAAVAFTIKGQTFTMLPRYAEGHICTAGEAAALNQTLRENVRNNLADKPNLTQQDVDTYLAEYIMGVGSARGPKRTREEIALDTVLMHELKNIAKLRNQKLPSGEKLASLKERFLRANEEMLKNKAEILLTSQNDAVTDVEW
jgi:hypothetical protein